MKLKDVHKYLKNLCQLQLNSEIVFYITTFLWFKLARSIKKDYFFYINFDSIVIY